jgi:hypothetical protein
MEMAVVARNVSLALFAVLGVCLGIATRSADGYVVKGRAWPGGIIRYYNAAPDQRWAVQRAVAAWNSSGARVRFVAVPAAQAQLRIEHFQGASCTINAEATVGYAASARVWIYRRDQSSPYCNSYMAVQALTHELGHVLGLGHELRGCSRMNPSGSLQGPRLCSRGASWQWRCQMLTPDDVAGAVALYGGSPREEQGPEDCDLYAAIQSPSGLRVAWADTPPHVRVSFSRPPSIGVPTFLSAQEHASEAFVAVDAPNRCETDPRAHAGHVWSVRPGGVQSIVMTLPRGTDCLSVWAIDSFGRPSAQPVSLWVRI